MGNHRNNLKETKPSGAADLRRKENTMSEYVGTIGQKITVKVKLVNEFSYENNRFSYYGTTNYIYTFVDEAENVFVWKTTSILAMKNSACECGLDFIRKGDSIIIAGKIKEHSEYKGTKQTVLERCKVTEIIERAITQEERDFIKAQEQRDSIQDGDFIWTMPYRQYKEHYSDCETIAGSFFDGRDKYGRKVRESTIDVIVRAGRLKNSGVRGRHFAGYVMKNQRGEKIVYRAVSEDNAMKRAKKDFPEDTWECFTIY